MAMSALNPVVRPRGYRSLTGVARGHLMSATGRVPVGVLRGQTAGNWVAVANRVSPAGSWSAKTNTQPPPRPPRRVRAPAASNSPAGDLPQARPSIDHASPRSVGHRHKLTHVSDLHGPGDIADRAGGRSNQNAIVPRGGAVPGSRRPGRVAADGLASIPPPAAIWQSPQNAADAPEMAT